MLETLFIPHIPSRFLEDEKYHDWYIRGINPLPGVKVLGVHIPDIRKIATDLIKEGKAEQLIRDCEHEQPLHPRSGLTYEEKMLWGMLLNGLPCPFEDKIERIARFIPAIDNWYVCDIFCGDAKWSHTYKAETWAFLQDYFHSTLEFDVRFAVVLSLYHYLEEEYIDEIFRCLKELDYEQITSEYDFAKTPTAPDRGIVGGPAPYYVNMAVAWLLATTLDLFPEKTREFVHSGAVPDKVMKLYLRKAKESFRTRDVNPK